MPWRKRNVIGKHALRGKDCFKFARYGEDNLARWPVSAAALRGRIAGADPLFG